MECREMDPIVHEVTKKYRACMKFERVNFHIRSDWHDLILPVGTPEFALLDSSKQILYRWFGRVEPEEFADMLNPLCT